MGIELLLIATGGVVLTQDHTPTLKQSQVVKKLVDTLSTSADKKASYNFEGSQYHCLVENQICYITAADPQTTLMTAYTMLNDVKEQFKQQFSGGGGYPKPAELNPGRCAPFSGRLQTAGREYTQDPSKGSKMGKLKSDIEDVKSQMLTNLDDLVKRGGDIENLCDKTQMLTEDAHVFEGESRRLRRKMLIRNIKLAIAIFLTVCLLILIIAMIACDPNFDKCKSKSPPPPPPTPAPPTPAGK